jgi:hypothetical protein
VAPPRLRARTRFTSSETRPGTAPVRSTRTLSRAQANP